MLTIERLDRYRLPARAQDAVLALVVVVLQVQGTVSKVEAEPATVIRPLADFGGLGLVLLAASAAALVVRRRWPVAVFLATALASVTYYSLDYPDGPGWIALFVATYTLTALGDGHRSLALAASAIIVMSVVWLVAGADVEPRAAVGWIFFRIGAMVMSAALGESVRSRRVIAAEALERAELAERTREEEARRRVDEERLRIAREVHDTVAHAIAVINVQAGVTAHVLDRRPDEARATLEAIERTSSRALDEMRAILGVLRDDRDDRAPQPGMADLDELTHTAREAGLDLTFERTGADVPVSSAVGGAVYRILQESVTNVIRHAGPTKVTVALSCDHRTVELRVADDGRNGGIRPGASPGEPGRGLRGMRERCQLLGGDLDARPTPAGGFQVVARLPLTPGTVVP
ncbi:sensor histidine kinase [Mumia sp. zg.B17]|uniref:sensor histidine kinase n=1 Tax=Mumia sp. zg.B17 TaxID=2855446 RepID=UPI001C6EA696|nr:sensor histidine kinase [Mumia sp. zg.B17]MBW9206330.1 sensor histidine kinase [Mumia sp. zg.B17]